MKQTISLNQQEIQSISEFAQKYPSSVCVEISVNSGSGIGQLVEVSVATLLNEDWVTVTKSITDESSW